MTRDEIHAHVRNPANYTAVRDPVADRWIGTAYRAAAGHYRAVRFYGPGSCDGPYAAVEDAVEAILLDYYSRSTESSLRERKYPMRSRRMRSPA